MYKIYSQLKLISFCVRLFILELGNIYEILDYRQFKSNEVVVLLTLHVVDWRDTQGEVCIQFIFLCCSSQC